MPFLGGVQLLDRETVLGMIVVVWFSVSIDGRVVAPR